MGALSAHSDENRRVLSKMGSLMVFTKIGGSAFTIIRDEFSEFMSKKPAGSISTHFGNLTAALRTIKSSKLYIESAKIFDYILYFQIDDVFHSGSSCHESLFGDVSLGGLVVLPRNTRAYRYK